MRIAINGLGRIGRCVLRAFYEMNYHNQGLELVAVNSRSSIDQHAHLLKYDSVHGKFSYDVVCEENNIKINSNNIHVFNEPDPAQINWQEFGVDIVLECSGAFNKRAKAEQHQVKKVLVSAPVADADKIIIYGVNHHNLQPSDKVISMGSCTTNCLAPIVSLLHQEIGIEHGFMTTIHSYTNDQNIVDNSHKKDWRRARACGVSIVPTSTGAAKMIGNIIPELNGKLDGSAVRVPVPNVSMIDFKFNSRKNTSIDEINGAVQHATHHHLKNVVTVSSAPLVSIDFTHNTNSAIFDLLETKVTNNKFARVVAWYDNEWGFANRMLDIATLL